MSLPSTPTGPRDPRRFRVTLTGDFFEADGSLAGPGYSDDEAAGLPEQYRLPGVVIKPRVAAPT